MKIALVTGAYKGLGLTLCKQLAIEGYTVILTASELAKATEAARQINKETHLPVFGKAMNVTNESEISNLAAWVEEKFGKIDVIINNAGINPKDYPDKDRMAKAFYLDSLDANELWKVIQVNSIAPLLVAKHFRKLLRQSPQPKIINISSWLGSVTNLSFGGHYGYVGSKSLLNTLNKGMSLELAKDGITSVNVNPGWVQTDMGGSKATFTPEEASCNIINNVLKRVTNANSGQFLNYTGEVHPW